MLNLPYNIWLHSDFHESSDMLQKVQDQSSVLLKRGVYTKSAVWNMGKLMCVEYEYPLLYVWNRKLIFWH